MAGGQTPDSDTPQEGAPVVEPASQKPAADSDQASASAAAAAAVSAVSAAIAAASKASPKPSPKSAKPPLAVEGYVRAPGRDVPGLTRAHADEPEAAAGTPLEPLPKAPVVPVVAADPYRKYKRPVPEVPGGAAAMAVPAAAPVIAASAASWAPGHAADAVPDVPGITRAHHEAVEAIDEPARPAPLFSNEGIVRAAQDRPRNPITGAIGGGFDAVLDAGTALGHSLGSHFPGSKTAIESPVLHPRTAPRTHRRRTVFLLACLASILVVGIALGSIILPTPDNSNNGFPHSPGASGNPNDNWNGQVDPNATIDPRANASGVVIGDESLAPGATRRPGVVAASPTPSGSFCWYMPTPSPSPTISGSPSQSPSPSPSSSSSPTLPPTPSPTPTMIRTACPAARQSRAPTPIPSATATPSPTAVPTPTPTPEMFAEVDQPTPPTWAGNDGSFWVASLPGASCRLFMTVGGSVRAQSRLFTITIGGDLDGWFFASWGANWPSDVANETVSVYATCTPPAPDPRPAATSVPVPVVWPPLAPPTPTPTPIPTTVP